MPTNYQSDISGPAFDQKLATIFATSAAFQADTLLSLNPDTGKVQLPIGYSFLIGNATATVVSAAYPTPDLTTAGGVPVTLDRTITDAVLVTPDLGEPVSGILTNATGLPIATGVSGLGTGIAAQLAVPTTGTGALVAQSVTDAISALQIVDEASIATNTSNIATNTANIASLQGQISASSRTWPTTAAGIGNGIAGVTSIVAGSGGTDGTFAVAYSGGTQVLAPVGVFTVTGGALVSVVITYPGYYRAGTPTFSFAASSGLTGASAVAQMAANTPVNGYFNVPSTVSGEALITYQNVAGVATEVARYPASSALTTMVLDIDTNVLPSTENYVTSLNIRSVSTILALTNQTDLIKRGYVNGIQWGASSDYARYATGGNLSGKWLFGAFYVYSTNAANLSGITSAVVVSEVVTGGAINALTSLQSGYIFISPQCKLVWCLGQVAVTAANALVGSTSTPVDTTRFATGFTLQVFDAVPNPQAILRQMLIRDQSRESITILGDRVTALGDTVSSLENAMLISTSANLFDLASIQDGKYVLSNGNIGTSAAWACSDYIPVIAGEQYTLSWVGTKRLGVSFFTTDVTTTGIVGSYNLDISSPWTVMAPAGAAFMVFNVRSDSIPIPSNIMVNKGGSQGFYEAYSPPGPLVDEIENARGSYSTLADRLDGQKGQATLVLSGVGNSASYVQSDLSGDTIQRSFVAFPSQTLADVYPVVFNVGADSVNGVMVRSSIFDDVAPDHIMGTTLGANHGWRLGECTATGHGKTVADQGSIWTSGGVEVVIVQVVSSSVLLIAQRSTDTAPATGTYTHVSGAVNTAGFTVSASVSSQWYPSYTNYRMRVIIDGEETSERSGVFGYRDSVQFIESYDLLERADLVAWWEANADTLPITVPGGSASLSRQNTYEYDRDAQLTIYQDWIALRATELDNLMGLQASRSAGCTDYYVPQTVDFTHDAQSVNYALLEAANRTSVGGLTSVLFTPVQCEATGPYADRFLQLHGSDYVHAIGFLPVGSTGLTQRRTECSEFVWEIRGDTDKVYGRVVEKGIHTMDVGERYSTIAYRWIGPKPAGRTASYVVRTQGADYLFADWHNFTGEDRIELPADLLGRDFTVVASRGVTLRSDILTGDLRVGVSSTGSYSFIQIKVS